MANRVTFQSTKFVNINEDLIESKPVYGYRVYDDYGQSYNNTLKKEDLIRSPEDALKVIEDFFGNNEFYSVILEKGGFFFNGSWQELDEDGEIIK